MDIRHTLCALSILWVGSNQLLGQAGTLDPSFGNGGVVVTDLDGVQNYGYASVLQPDGRIVVVGGSYGPIDTTFTVLRYESNGELDPTFGTDGAVQLNFNGSEAQGLEVALQADGRIIVGGLATGDNYDFGLARLMPDGSLDASFDGDGYLMVSPGFAYDHMCSVLVQPDGRILVGGISLEVNSNPWAIMRFESDGSPDMSFGVNGIVREPADTATTTLPTAMALQPDGKILLTGRQGSAGTEDFGLTRRNTDGSADMSIGTDGWAIWDINSTNDQPGAILVQPDGRIVISGVSAINTAPFDWTITMLRCNADGTLDDTFGQGGITTNYVASDFLSLVNCALQQDGRIVASTFFNDGGDFRTRLQRYTSGGVLDPTFDLDGWVISDPTAAVEWTYDVLIQPDQKIVLTGFSGFDIMVLRYLNDPDVGVAEPTEFMAEALVYPNPVDDLTSLGYELSRSECLSLFALDGEGRVVRRFFSDQQRSPGRHLEQVDFSGLAVGGYTIVLSHAEGNMSVNVMKK